MNLDVLKTPPPASDEITLKRMKSTGQRDTAPELALRAVVHRMGLRYRVDRRPIPGLRRKADLVFVSAKVAVFVDGCFWHCCPKHVTWPKENAEYWRTKIERNRQRDAETDRRLAAAGWVVVRVWEHENPEEAALKVAAAVQAARGR